MAESSFAFELVTPTKLLVSEEVGMITAPGSEGDFGALPGHAPFLSTLRPGVIEVTVGGVITRRLFVASGFAEVSPTRVTVLTEEAIAVADITPDLIASRTLAATDALQAATTPHAKALAEQRLIAAQALAAAA